MINFSNVTKVYPHNHTALEEISFKIEEKEFVSLVGKSGAGKTTLFKLLLVEEKPTQGRIFFEGKDLAKIKGKDLPQTRRRMGTVFQDYKLLPLKNTYENVAYILEVIGKSDKEIEKEVPEVLDIVGLADKAKIFPHELSAGEC